MARAGGPPVRWRRPVRPARPVRGADARRHLARRRATGYADEDMHIPDGLLSAKVAAATMAVAGAGVALSLRAERGDPQPVPAATLGAVASFLFAAQLVNLPVAPGTSGHLVGAALAAAILGPWRAVLVMAVVLIIQAVLFQDGGLTALGANLVDMGLAGSLSAYAVATLTGRLAPSPRGYAVGVMAGAFVATLAAASLTAFWLGVSGLYPLAGILPLMLTTHAAIGVLEAALTGAIVVTLLRWRPDLLRGLEAGGQPGRTSAVVLGVFGTALAIAAFLAPFASALPDGLEHTMDVLGIRASPRSWAAPLAGYVVPLPLSARLTSAIAGAAGTVLVGAIAFFVSRGLAAHHHAPHR
jgi:cobalt/nickel transport system permease protein